MEKIKHSEFLNKMEEIANTKEETNMKDNIEVIGNAWDQKGDNDGNPFEGTDWISKNKYGYTAMEIDVIKRLGFPVQIIVGADKDALFYKGVTIAIAVNSQVVDRKEYGMDEALGCITPAMFKDMVQYILKWLNKENIKKSIMVSESIDGLMYGLNGALSEAVMEQRNVCGIDMTVSHDPFGALTKKSANEQVDSIMMSLETILKMHYAFPAPVMGPQAVQPAATCGGWSMGRPIVGSAVPPTQPGYTYGVNMGPGFNDIKNK